MISLTWEGGQVSSFDDMVARMPDSVLASPRRSTIPLVDLCRVPDRAAELFAGIVGIPARWPCELAFEYEVPVQRGVGKPSCTDLMVLMPDAAVAVEAKRTEPEYESVRGWLAAGGSNRGEVLAGWLGLLSASGTRPVAQADVLDLPYQLIHRCASAAQLDRPQRAVVYLVFGEQVAAHYEQHMRALQQVVGTRADLKLVVASCRMEPSDIVLKLEARWDAGERELAKDVRAGLLRGPLFSFAKPRQIYAGGVHAL